MIRMSDMGVSALFIYPLLILSVTGTNSGQDADPSDRDWASNVIYRYRNKQASKLSDQKCERGMGDDVTKWYPPYLIVANNRISKRLLCDTQTDGGGWIVIQRRFKGDTDFFRNWTEYRDGFGCLDGDFWLGNEAIHNLTNEHRYELRIDARWKGRKEFAGYNRFKLENEDNMYRLQLGYYVGTLGEEGQHTGLSYSRGQNFSTFDRDNDNSEDRNCAVYMQGAWWYNACHRTNLNGQWGLATFRGVSWSGVGQQWWHNFKFLYFTEMKIRKMPSPRS
ncbi:tenascin-R, partial [Elysia marginata]